MVENRGHIDVSRIIESVGKEPAVRLHLAPYFKVNKTKQEQKRVYNSHGLKPVYDPVRVTPKIEEELWEDGLADKNGFFTFLPERLILGHTLESIEIPANIFLRMRKFFYSEKTKEILPLTTNLTAPLIHPKSTGPQTYEIVNMSSQMLNVCVSDLVCVLDVKYLNDSFIHVQQRPARSGFSNQLEGEIKLGNPGKNWEFEAIRERLGLS